MMRLSRMMFAVIAAATASQAAAACEAPPPHLYVSDEALAARSARIALVEIIGETQPAVDATSAFPGIGGLTPFRARVIENLLGADTDEITVYGDPGTVGRDAHGFLEVRNNVTGEIQTDFGAHSSDQFWQVNAGGAPQGTDCLAHPAFAAGQRYLVFLGAQHVRGYELILEEDDAWLAQVRHLIADGD